MVHNDLAIVVLKVSEETYPKNLKVKCTEGSQSDLKIQNSQSKQLQIPKSRLEVFKSGFHTSVQRFGMISQKDIRNFCMLVIYFNKLDFIVNLKEYLDKMNFKKRVHSAG